MALNLGFRTLVLIGSGQLRHVLQQLLRRHRGCIYSRSPRSCIEHQNEGCVLPQDYGVVRQVVSASRPGDRQVSEEGWARPENQSRRQSEAVGGRKVEGHAHGPSLRPPRARRRVLSSVQESKLPHAEHESSSRGCSEQCGPQEGRTKGASGVTWLRLLRLLVVFLRARIDVRVR